ncbi:MAG: cobalt ECF transporter T component CbiQ [Acidobacteriota bacterium]
MTSPQHRDARGMFVFLTGFVVTVSGVPAGFWPGYLLPAACGALLLRPSPEGWRALALRSWWLLPALLVGAALLFVTPGRPWFAVPGPALTATWEGALRWFDLGLRVTLCWTALTLGLAGYPKETLLRSLSGLGIPSTLVGMLAIMARYTELLIAEGERMLRARASRSPAPAGLGWRPRRALWLWRMNGALLGTLFLRALARGERVHQAMLARGYDGTPRWAAPMSAPGRRDWLLGVAGVAMPLVLLGWVAA